VVLAPQTSVVFYLPTNVDPNPPPSRPLYIAAAGGNGSVAVGWTHAGGAAAYNVKRSLISGSGYTTIASGVTNNFLTDASVANGTTYYYVVTGTNDASESGSSPQASATPLSTGLPAPWENTNFTTAGGSASLASGAFTLTSPQGDIWGTMDGCQFVCQPMIGNGMVTARVKGSSSGNTYAKAGVMIRASLASNDVMAAIDMERVAGRAEMGYRTSAGNSCSLYASTTGLALPYWVRLQRAASVITSYISPDGTNWIQVGSVSLNNLPYMTYVGLCASPADWSSGQTTTATFDNATFPLGANALPPVPSALTANGANLAAVLNWTTVSNAVTYNVKRSTSDIGPFTTVATGVVSPPYTDFGLNNNSNYFYVVTAVNSQGESAASSLAGATPVPPPPLTASVVAVGSNTVINVFWAAVSGATSYNVYRAPFSRSTLQFSLLTNVVTTNCADGAVTASSPYFYYVTALTNASESAWSATVGAVAPGVPAPWTTRDIGSPDMPGYAFQTNGVFNLNAAGTDIWNTSDQFSFTFQPVTPDCDLRARVLNIAGTSTWAKAGVMIRQSLDAGAAYAFCLLTPAYGTTQNGVAFQERTSSGASASQVAQTSGLIAPYWVRLSRTNSTFTAYNSPDGTNWTSMGSTAIAMNGTVYAGLALCGNLNNEINTTLMDQVTVQPGTPSAPAGLFAIPGNAQVTLYWSASDGATSYNVKRSLTSGSGYVTVRNATGTNMVDAGLTNGTTYYYVVSALNGGESTNSVQVSATPNLITTPPATPLNLTAAAGDGRITLNWNAAAGAFGYNVKRSTNSGAEVLIGTSVTTNYVDTAVSVGKTYYYVVSGTNNLGESTNSTESGATVQFVTVIWSGATSAIWDTTATNWTANGSPMTYQAGFPVRFDDSALSNVNITVSVPVSPASMIFSNVTQAYALGGSAITGTNSLILLGAGMLTLNSSNSYSGGTTLTAGTLLAPNTNALGTGPVTLAGGTWLFTNSVTVTNSILAEANTTTAINESTYGASLILSGNLSGGGNLSTTATANYGGVQLAGNNGGYSGTLTVNNNGSQRFRFLAATAGSSNAVWVLNNNTTDGQSANFGPGTLYFGALAGGGQFRQDTSGTTTLEIGALNASTTFSGMLYQSGSGSILGVNKVGTGTLTLSGANSYAGLTAVKQGRLLVNQGLTGGGGFVVSNNATLGLTNNLSATSSALGALTLVAGATLEFQNVSNLNSALAAATTVTVNGACTNLITGTNHLAAGNSYPLLNYTGSFSGAFTNLQLQMPYGWRGTLVNSGTQISLAGVAVVSTLPPRLAVTNTGRQLQFSWPVANTGWRFQTQINPLNLGLGTNWTDIPATSTNQVSVPIVTTNGSVFFRLVYP
jgi:autotransporter-associated beta strand protein